MTNEQMVKAFNEWMRRFIEEPERFGREFQSVHEYQTELAKGVEPSYGQDCSAYLNQLVQEAAN